MPREYILLHAPSPEGHGDPASGSRHYQSHVGDALVHTYQTLSHKLEYYKPWNPKESKRETCFGPPTLVGVSSPCLSTKSLHYSVNYFLESCGACPRPFRCIYTPIQDPEIEPHYAVASLQYPIGEDDAMVSTHTFSNQRMTEGRTLKVTHHDQSTTTFHYSSHYLPTKVQYAAADGQLLKETRYEWTDNQWQRAIEVLDGRGELLYRKEFEYDSFGNPVVTTLTGDLQGDGIRSSTSIRRQFSQDGRHLLLQETNDDGVTTHCSYLPGTNLLLGKLTGEGDRTIKRAFYQYDSSYNLVAEFEDDGSSDQSDDLSGVTQRLIKRMTYRQENPNLHMRDSESEYFLEDCQEKLLKRTHYHYDTRGYVCQEDVYDATNKLVYSLFKKHNAKGDLLSETNALGQSSTYTYDDNGRRLSSTSFCGSLTSYFTYDAHGRPTSRKEVASDGTERVTLYRFDANNRLVEKTNHLGNATHYTYASFNKQPTRIDSPSAQALDGTPIAVVERFEYDALGRESAHTDPNGATTRTCYTVYDHPADIIYPDGTRETHRYSPTGRLLRQTDRQGLTTVYTYDALERVTSKTYSKDDSTLGTESFIYDAFHLKSKTDLEGNRTFYTYDKAGRLIREECAGQVRLLAYDTMGLICSETHENGDNSLHVRFERDLLGRLTKRTKSDSTGQVLYLISKSYDAAGNVATITRYPEEGVAVDTYRYDAWGRLVEHRDPLGNRITTHYDESQRNSLCQKVLTTIQRDKEGVVTHVTYDANEREVEHRKIAADGTLLTHDQLYYDPAGNLLQRMDHLWAAGRYLGAQSVRYSYTPFGQVKSQTRAFGTQDQRTVVYTYHPDGQLATRTKADGTVLHYTYDAFGHLAQLHSSDGALLHTFTYNRLGHLLSAEDKASKIAISRTVDAFGRILSESVNGIPKIQKSYDRLGRTLTLECPGIAAISYVYDPLYMRSVTFRKNGTQASHRYIRYDLDGNLCEELLPLGCGSVARSSDLRGRHSALEGEFFSQYCQYDARDNLIVRQDDGKRAEYTYDDLSQLTTETADSTSESYEHDSNYNCVARNGQESNVNALNELIADMSTSYQYDANGNLIAKTCCCVTTRYEYDALDRLIRVVMPDRTEEMTYDPLGRRMRKITHQDQQIVDDEYYVYDDEEELGAFNKAGQPLQLRCLGRARHRGMAQCVVLELNGRLFVPVTDFQGNVRRVIDPASKSVSGSYDYSAYGQQTNVVEVPGLFNPWRYGAKRFDATTQMVYFGKRYYMPGMQRWLTTDPVGFTEGTNLYTFLLNSPFRYVDPDGQFAIPLLTAAFTASGGIVWSVPLLCNPYILVASIVCSYVAYKYPEVIACFGGICGYALCRDFPGTADEMADSPDWTETTHPSAGKKGHRTFTHNDTGETVRWDEGKANESGHKGKDHYHWHNPNSTGPGDKYLDQHGNPCGNGSPESHLYAP